MVNQLLFLTLVPGDYEPDPLTAGPKLPGGWKGDAWARERPGNNSYILRAWNESAGRCVVASASRYMAAREILFERIEQEEAR